MDKPQKKTHITEGFIIDSMDKVDAANVGYNSACDDWEKWLKQIPHTIPSVRDKIEKILTESIVNIPEEYSRKMFGKRIWRIDQLLTLYTTIHKRLYKEEE